MDAGHHVGFSPLGVMGDVSPNGRRHLGHLGDQGGLDGVGDAALPEDDEQGVAEKGGDQNERDQWQAEATGRIDRKLAKKSGKDPMPPAVSPSAKQSPELASGGTMAVAMGTPGRAGLIVSSTRA
jgi:hypothetical protein